MIKVEFSGATKTIVLRKIVNYWYSNIYGKQTFLDFLGDCIIKQVGTNFIIIYNGAAQIDSYKK